MNGLIINFGKVALTCDPIFGVSVHTEDGWVPFSSGSDDEKAWVRKEVFSSALAKTMPERMREELTSHLY